MPNRYASLTLLGLALAGPPATSGDPEPDMSWYVASLCPDDGIACTTEDAVYGQCLHQADPAACPDDGVFCNGEESCSAGQGGCVSSGMPCDGDAPVCDEANHRCMQAGNGGTDRGSGPRASRRAVGPPMSHALRFDGVDDIVTAQAPAALSITTALTLEAWVRPIQDPQPGRRGVIAGKDGQFLMARGPDGALVWALNAPSSDFGFVAVPEARLTQNVWSHVALTYDGALVRTYLNGALVSTHAATGAIRHAATPVGVFRIGGGYDDGHGADFFAGVINDVRLWRVARTGAAIAADRARRLRGTEAGLVGYWRLDEGRGEVVADAAHGNAGVLANGTRWVDGRASRVSTWI